MDERGISSTPKSLSTESSRHLEARGSSESSLTVPELRTLRITPAVIAIQAPGVESHAVDGKVKTNESTTETTAIPSKTGSVIFMRPRYSRRVQSKSEPAHRSPTSESIKCSEPPAKTTDDTTEQRRVSAPMAQSSSLAPSLIPKPGNKGSPAVRQLPIPPRNSSDGKCGTYPTATPKDNSERRGERIPPVTKEVKETASVPATATAGNENQPPPKTGENQSIITTSSRGGRSIRRLRTGSLRGRRGRVSRGPTVQNSQE